MLAKIGGAPLALAHILSMSDETPGPQWEARDGRASNVSGRTWVSAGAGFRIGNYENTAYAQVGQAAESKHWRSANWYRARLLPAIRG
jgi:hypothetical protein